MTHKMNPGNNKEMSSNHNANAEGHGGKTGPAQSGEKKQSPAFVVPGTPGITREEFDDLYSMQQNSIKQEVEKEPMISSIIETSLLIFEFENQPNFVKKVNFVIDKFGKTKLRKVRRDGSCFYRAFIYRLAEVMLEEKSGSTVKGLLAKVPEVNSLLKKVGFEELVFEDFEDAWKEFLERISTKKTTLEIIPAIFSDKTYFDYLVMYLRFAISAFVRSCPLFENYFESEKDIKNFCTREVEPIDCEADHIQITALFNLLNVPLRIFYIDNTDQEEPTVLSLPEIEKGVKAVNDSISKYPIQIMYRPGHYDLLY